VKPLHDSYYEPLWQLCEDLEVPIHSHGGIGCPDYGNQPVAALLYLAEAGFYSQRPFVHLLLSGVFERHPRLKFVMTEMGCAWLPPMLARLDATLAAIRDRGAQGELRFSQEHILPRSATDYFNQNCWLGMSAPSADDAVARRKLRLDRLMWGSDYPHDEGTYPYSRENLRAVFAGSTPDELHQILTTNAANLFGFDETALAPLGDTFGPTVAEINQPLDELPEGSNEALRRAMGALA
jgi:predicted TIM-barrel fold metal-dependent hydrolase